MLCPSRFQPSPFTMRPLLDPGWPVRSLWPDTRPLLHLVERELQRHLLETWRSLEHMEQLHQRLFQEMDQTWSRSGVFQTVAVRQLGGDGFALSLDTEAFSPEELSVKQVGRRLRVSGRAESKQEDSSSSSSSSGYSGQEFRQEFQLPHGVDPKAVTCSLVAGRLQIQAPQERALHDGKERLVPIRLTSDPASSSSSSSSPSSESSSAEKN